MVTEPMKHAHFDHPKHGSYRSPEDVLGDDRLSATQKQTVLDEWRSSLQHVLHDEPEASNVRSTSDSLDAAAERLAAGKI
ncbi:hypothetical protein [Jiella sonneratiae]|uniref:Uncharacterized protein n=1 Tax=Jiella sonneratiae TaxID=2816856 RepID=A0ABS3J8M7_9HYPH|nr:hypothetical protein [Jiella sonneratiae]MBO0906019.1 hypothetical protein [Jiella sonneratiae]